MAVSQTLSVTAVAGSTSVSSNTSKVRILWQSTQSGESRNEYTRTAYYYVSVNNGAETRYAVSYTLPRSTTKTIVDTTITVPHAEDGSCTVKVRTWMDTDISAGVVEKTGEVTISAIPRMATLDLVSSPAYVDGEFYLKYTPKSSAHYMKVDLELEANDQLTGICSVELGNKPAVQQAVTVALSKDEVESIYRAVTNTTMLWVRFTLRTYSDSQYSNQIGQPSTASVKTFIPDTSDTKPVVAWSLSPIHSLPSSFANLYIQGVSKVSAQISAEGRYGATISAKMITVEGKNYYEGAQFTSDYLSGTDSVSVSVFVMDSRGNAYRETKTITVHGYTKPSVQPAGQSIEIVCARCDENGALTDGGSYLKICAKRSYSKLISKGVQHNFCEIRYRYKESSAPGYSAWTTILTKDNLASDEVETEALLGGVLSLDSSYAIQIQAMDDVSGGEYGITTIDLPTEAVYWHRTKNGLGLGKYCEGENLLDVAWDANFHGEVRIGPEKIPLKDYILSVINGGG